MLDRNILSTQKYKNIRALLQLPVVRTEMLRIKELITLICYTCLTTAHFGAHLTYWFGRVWLAVGGGLSAANKHKFF